MENQFCSARTIKNLPCKKRGLTVYSGYCKIHSEYHHEIVMEKYRSNFDLINSRLNNLNNKVDDRVNNIHDRIDKEKTIIKSIYNSVDKRINNIETDVVDLQSTVQDLIIFNSGIKHVFKKYIKQSGKKKSIKLTNEIGKKSRDKRIKNYLHLNKINRDNLIFERRRLKLE
jgi:tetrahydromethanopterin S-methyltransferase subunit G